MEAIFKTERVVSESGLCHACGGLAKQSLRIPAYFEIAGCGKLKKAAQIVLAPFLQAHDVVVAIFNLQHAILGNVRWIGYGRPVWIGNDSILWRIGALGCSAGWKEPRHSLRQNDRKKIVN